MPSSSRKPQSVTHATYVIDATSQSYLTSAQVSRYLGMKDGVLRMWRTRGQGPAYVKFPGVRASVAYRETDVLEYIAAHVVQPKPR